MSRLSKKVTPKMILFLIAGTGFTLLLISGFYLAWLNPTPKFWGYFIGFIAAAIAAVFTLLTVLKPEKKICRFPVSIAVSATTQLPIEFYAGPDMRMMARTMMASRGANELKPGTNRIERRNIKFASVEEKQAFYCELLQYELLSQTFAVLCFDRGISASADASDRTVTTHVFSPVWPKKFYRLPSSEIVNIFKTNRFMSGMELNIWKNSINLPLPAGTSVSLPDQRSIIFEKTSFFRIHMSCAPVGGGKGLPPFLKKFIQNSDAETISFIVQLEAEFSALSAENPDTADIKAWASALFTGIEARLKDPEL